MTDEPAQGYEAFARIFQAPATSVAAAPGRVNLIGEHTDYNGGFVLPAAIRQRARVYLRLHPGEQVVRAASAQLEPAPPPAAAGPDGVATYTLGAEARRGGFIDYVQGVTYALRREGHGGRLCGFDLYVDSSVPLGSGLSSSAALEVALLRALRAALALPIGDVTLALLGQRAENELVGVPCGVMDQMAASLCTGDSALFLDTRTLRSERVPLLAGHELVVIHSGLAHQLANGDYRTRRHECEEAARRLGVQLLCELPCSDEVLARIAALPEPLGRRARHVVTEHARVPQAVAALRAGDGARLGALMSASHRSLRDDFEVSLPQIDRLVELCDAEPGGLGARLTGGGFGGSVVMFAPAGRGYAAATRIAARYHEATGCTPQVLLPPAPEPEPAGSPEPAGEPAVEGGGRS
ncbi:MAG: galactokinase [Polyangia bacterium]